MRSSAVYLPGILSDAESTKECMPSTSAVPPVGTRHLVKGIRKGSTCPLRLGPMTAQIRLVRSENENVVQRLDRFFIEDRTKNLIHNGVGSTSWKGCRTSWKSSPS